MTDLGMRHLPSDTELLDAIIQGRWAITDFKGDHFTLFEVRDRRGTILAVDADPRRAIEQARVSMTPGGVV